VKPRAFFGSDGCATFGLAMKVMLRLSGAPRCAPCWIGG